MVGKPSVVLEEDEFKIRDESKSIHVQGLSDYQEYDAGNRIKESPIELSITSSDFLSFETLMDKIEPMVKENLEVEEPDGCPLTHFGNFWTLWTS